jgi:putative ABC transport system permease protein
VTAYIIVERRHEFSIRLALGARQQDLRKLVLVYGFKLTAVGLMVGPGISLGINRMFVHYMYGVAPSDFFSFFSASILLLLATLIACYIPRALYRSRVPRVIVENGKHSINHKFEKADQDCFWIL